MKSVKTVAASGLRITLGGSHVEGRSGVIVPLLHVHGRQGKPESPKQPFTTGGQVNPVVTVTPSVQARPLIQIPRSTSSTSGTQLSPHKW